MKDLLYSLLNVLKTIQIIDIIDILLLTYIVYKAIKLIRETRAGQLIKGIMLLLITYVLCNLFEFKAITFILKKAAIIEETLFINRCWIDSYFNNVPTRIKKSFRKSRSNKRFSI